MDQNNEMKPVFRRKNQRNDLGKIKIAAAAAAAVVLLGLFIFAVLRWTRRPEGKRMPLKHLIAYAVGFLLLAGAVVALEFAVGKSPTLSVAMAYLLEACCAVGFGVITWQVVMKN